jgi:membrane-associated phospholipid phosphatase
MDRAVPARGRYDARPAQRVAVPERASPTRHGPIAQLLIAWSPLSVILLVYAVAQWVNAPLDATRPGHDVNRLGFALHVADPAAVDSAVFGAIPSIWLQQRLVDGAPHWYDALAALVYATHFVLIPLLTGVLWFRRRERFVGWLAAVLTFTIVGMSGYITYPAAPPWLASAAGATDGVTRISGLGWAYLHLHALATLTSSGQDASNPVAAMPSLHAGAALLIALFLWPLTGKLWRAALLCYALLMAVALVYTGEHYVVDVVAGWLTAGIAAAAGAVVCRHRRDERPLSGHPH